MNGEKIKVEGGKDCPNCGKAKMKIHEACCQERAEGAELVLVCPDCGYREKYL